MHGRLNTRCQYRNDSVSSFPNKCECKSVQDAKSSSTPEQQNVITKSLRSGKNYLQFVILPLHMLGKNVANPNRLVHHPGGAGRAY